MRLIRENRRASFLAILSVLALMVSLAVVRDQLSSGALNQSMAAGSSLQVSCTGNSLTTSATSATTVNLDCLTKAPVPPVQVGQATTFEAGSSGSPSTTLPAGTAAGDVLVSYVESYSFTSISCGAGSTETLDQAVNGGARLAACVTVAKTDQGNPAATVSPPTQVSMVTMAFSGVSTTNPVDASEAATGATSPSVTTDTPGTALVLALGTDSWQLNLSAPTGSILGAAVNDGGNSEVAIAVASGSTSGPTASAAWPHVSAVGAVGGTIALRPATSGSSPTDYSPQPSTPSEQMTANTAMTVSCEGSSLTVTGTGPTTVTLNCLAAQPIAQVGSATSFSSSSSGSPTTSLPHGVQAGDVLVSYVESYAFTSIDCDSGSTETFDVSNGSGARLAACVTVATIGQGDPMARVSPPTQVSMLTTAFSGVNNTDPVNASRAVPGDVSPSVTNDLPGSALVFGEGSDAWKLVALAPGGSQLVATVNNSGDSQVAGAIELGMKVGASPASSWSPTVTGSAPVAATIALTPSSSITPPTTTTTDPTTTTTTDPTTTTSTAPTTTTTTDPTTTTTTGPTTTTTSPGGSGSAPSTPPVEICGDASVLTGPSSAPSGAVTVPSGNNASLTLNTPNTTYWFAPGTHTLGSGQYSQIIPSNGDSYIGGPGAIINGQGLNDFAFTQMATNITIEYLTIEDFGQNSSILNQNEGVVNQGSASNWTIKYDTVEDNEGAGVMLGTNDVVEYNCLTENGQYGFSSYLPPPGPSNITLSYNEVSYNDTYNWEVKDPGCGCSGGGKFWNTDGATVTDNYVHNNENVGIWADTDNAGFNISGNYISNNFSEGVMYEISYNANISDNTFIRNALGAGPLTSGFPEAALYISESGSDSRVAGPYGNTFQVSGNVFEDNWSGVVLWENSDRFCGPDSPDNAGSLCTLVDPSGATPSTCVTPGINTAPLFSNCRWKTQNVDVTDNTFDFEPSDIGSDCTQANSCGYNGIFSEYGVTAPYTAWIVPKDIADSQNNHFANNTYTGPWSFMGPDQGGTATWSQWTKGYTDNADGSGIYFDPQDSGSTLNS